MGTVHHYLRYLLAVGFLVLVAAGLVQQPASAAPLPHSFLMLDPSFGAHGIRSFTPTAPDNANVSSIGFHELFIMPNGKLIAGIDFGVFVGKSEMHYSSFARFSSNGAVEQIEINDPNADTIIGIQPTGKLILTGSKLARYDTNFTLDPSFVFTDTALLAGIKAVLPDGRILLEHESKLYRITNNGAIDNSFPSDLGPFEMLYDIVPHTNNGFLLMEQSADTCTVHMFNASATRIATLYEFPKVALCWDRRVNFIPTADGGYLRLVDGYIFTKSKSDGTIDTNFGTNGSVDMRELINLNIDWPLGPVALQGDGKLVFIAQTGISDTLRWFVARLNANGSFDTAFGTQELYHQAALLHGISDLQVAADGSLLVVGSTNNNPDPEFFMIKLREIAVQSRLFLPLVRN